MFLIIYIGLQRQQKKGICIFCSNKYPYEEPKQVSKFAIHLTRMHFDETQDKRNSKNIYKMIQCPYCKRPCKQLYVDRHINKCFLRS